MMNFEEEMKIIDKELEKINNNIKDYDKSIKKLKRNIIINENKKDKIFINLK